MMTRMLPIGRTKLLKAVISRSRAVKAAILGSGAVKAPLKVALSTSRKSRKQKINIYSVLANVLK
ncbi:hypothetical protein D3C78_1684700 [compost metagenome]